MEEILYQHALIDGAAEQRGVPRADTLKYQLYLSLLQEHGLTREQFDSSLTWYAKHLDLFEPITNNVTERLDNERK